MTSIDSFIGFPLLVVAILSVILILFLSIIKIRKTANISFVTFISTALIAIGALISYFMGYYMYFVITAIIAMVVITPYLIIKIFDTPERKKAVEQKKAEAAAVAARSQDSVSKAELNALETKYQRLIDVNIILEELKEYPFEYDERYSLTKFFGEAAYKRITGKCYVDIDPAGNRQQLTFIMEYNGTRYPLSMEFKSHTSRLSGKPRFSYWKFDKYIAFIEKKNIIIQMRKARTTIYREFRCLLEMVMTPRKAVYIVLLIRLAYLATRPFYRKKNIWMF